MLGALRWQLCDGAPWHGLTASSGVDRAHTAPASAPGVEQGRSLFISYRITLDSEKFSHTISNKNAKNA